MNYLRLHLVSTGADIQSKMKNTSNVTFQESDRHVLC